ncbi:MAG TPA: Gfo/Idh/MocA family oxidoreductase [Mycobacteriales bacterium]|nr:Gfo/Idh/MocA family oxidoreductase [Mycobacteriales bacterium]
MTLRVALAGCAGLSKQNHQRDMYAPAFAAHPGFSIVAATGPNCQELAIEYGVPYQEELIPADVDVLSVCVPLEERIDVVQAALEAGRHVLADKPVSIDPVAAQRITNQSGIFVPAHHHRFNPSIRSAGAAIAAGRIGLPWSVHADFLIGGGDPVAEGELVNFGAYPIDAVHALIGQEVWRVHAYSDGNTSTLLLDHTHGVLSTITVGRCRSSRSVQRYRISGSHGMLMIDATKPALEVDTVAGVTRGWIGPDTVAALIEDLHGAITTGRPPAVGTADMVRVARVIAAAEQSLKTGRPVELAPEEIS